MTSIRKFRNVAGNGRVAFVVDDMTSIGPWRARCLEMRPQRHRLTADSQTLMAGASSPCRCGELLDGF